MSWKKFNFCGRNPRNISTEVNLALTKVSCTIKKIRSSVSINQIRDSSYKGKFSDEQITNDLQVAVEQGYLQINKGLYSITQKGIGILPSHYEDLFEDKRLCENNNNHMLQGKRLTKIALGTALKNPKRI
jgi:hypothetical protein